MPRKSRSEKLLDKSVSAMVAAIGVYNHPDQHYREESFAILALNAWELLLKAKILADNGNSLRSIFIYESRQTASGKNSSKKYIKKNRSGNPMTVGIAAACRKIQRELPSAVEANLDVLTEIRDNSAHFVNETSDFGKRTQEIGAACIQNFVRIIQQWFKRDLSDINFFLMPLALTDRFMKAADLVLTSEETNFIDYIAAQEGRGDRQSEFAVTLRIDVSLRRKVSADLPTVRITTDPTAPAVHLDETDIRNEYPWDYRELTNQLRTRYTDFKENQRYHDLRKPLADDTRYSFVRQLDPGNEKSLRKQFFSRNVLNVFDQHYTR